MTGIIDYGVGNLFSLYSSLKLLGEDVFMIKEEKDYEKCERIILPGVGSFIPARDKLKESGLEEGLYRSVEKGKLLLGICLGMQLLFEEGEEEGKKKGLALIRGNVKSIKNIIPKGNKIPHMGWNTLSITKPSRLFSKINDGDYVYFVHSYSAQNCLTNTTSITDYGAPLVASVEKDNVFGLQFHPEKSGEVGLRILSSFLEIK